MFILNIVHIYYMIYSYSFTFQFSFDVDILFPKSQIRPYFFLWNFVQTYFIVDLFFFFHTNSYVYL